MKENYRLMSTVECLMELLQEGHMECFRKDIEYFQQEKNMSLHKAINTQVAVRTSNGVIEYHTLLGYAIQAGNKEAIGILLRCNEDPSILISQSQEGYNTLEEKLEDYSSSSSQKTIPFIHNMESNYNVLGEYDIEK